MHLFLNSIRVETRFQMPPWSIFIFKTQTCNDRRLNFDFKDNPLLLTVSLRMNDVGIVAVLQDNGAVKALDLEDIGLRSAKRRALHPVQFSEATAKVFYAASLINRTPKFINIGGPDGSMDVMCMPLGGLSSKPIFEPWNMADYARFLS